MKGAWYRELSPTYLAVFTLKISGDDIPGSAGDIVSGTKINERVSISVLQQPV